MKLIVVGGVAGGASAAARARRLDEAAQIILFERGEYVSFANCGLPYHIGNVIVDKDDLFILTPDTFNKRTNIDVRICHEVVSVDADRKSVKVFDLRKKRYFEEKYDKLILSTGSSPFRPNLPGLDDPLVMVLWTINDMDRIIARINKGIKSAVVMGGGFIGLEVAENLQKRDVETTVVEMLPQVMPNFDFEMAESISGCLKKNNIRLVLNNAVTKLERKDNKNGQIVLTLQDNTELSADLVIMSVGVRPNSKLAEHAGMKIGNRGGIVVDKRLETSNPDIYAVGDVIETYSPVLNTPVQIPLAGPANKQGRIAAENALGGSIEYGGAIGTSICKVFDLSVATAGANEKTLKEANIDYCKIYCHPFSHASYYPGAKPLSIKLLFNTAGMILGCQITGEDGVDKRIDVIATAIRSKLSVYDLEELELAYAPPYGSAKDPVNFAGFIAANVLKQDSQIVHADKIPEDAFLLDIRDDDEVEIGVIPGSCHIPLGKLRSCIETLPKDKMIVTFCKIGLRGYLAERILRQKGFSVKNLSGGIITWNAFHPKKQVPLDSCIPCNDKR